VLPAVKIVELFHELRRRRVFRVAAAYAVGGWVVVQLASIVIPALELPDRLVLVVLALVIAGLPVAVFLSWAYDLTPEGVQATADAAGADGKRPRVAEGPRDGSALASVAVLPFENLTPTTQHTYLAEAIPIELQALLSRLPELRVVSRQSSVARSAAKSDLRTIAQSLSVQYVISGSVADLGERLQVNVQLDDALEDTLLWSERYEVLAKDIAGLQSAISEKVVGTFGGERLRAEIRRANEAATSNTNAWQLVQKARAYLLDYTPASVAAAVPLLRRAVELDPKYAVAYATLGLVTAEKTLSAISSNAAADRRFAIEAINRAERLAPRDPVVLRAAGCVHAYTGAYRASLGLLRRAAKLAPYDLGTWGYFGWPLVATGEPQSLDELHGIIDRLLATAQQHPGRVYWLFHKSVAFVCANDCDRALALAEECTSEQAHFSLGWMNYANVLGRLGRNDAARRAVEQSLTINPLMKPDYYAALMAVLTDQPTVIERRTSGLYDAGILMRAA
jgi:adenylate cyclase